MKHFTIPCTAMFFATMALAGCTSSHWQKPGATNAQLQTDQAQCDAAAKLQFPPHIETIPVTGGSFNPGASQCGNPNNTDDTQCYSSPNQWQAPTYRQADTNAKHRANVVRACMIKKGWQLDD